MLIPYLKQEQAKRRFAKRISLKKNLSYFNFLYHSIDGYACMHELPPSPQAVNLIYGDVDFHSFAASLSLIQPTSKDIFFDLGSGVGKACVIAALAYDIHDCRGIEIVPSLHQLAMRFY